MIRHVASFALIIGFAWAASPHAVAERFVRLNAEQLHETLFGVRLSGELARTGIPWSQCITPEGDTVDEFEGRVRNGELTINEQAQACFTYDGRPNCFEVFRAGDRLLLDANGTEFSVNKIETGITSCQATKAIS